MTIYENGALLASTATNAAGYVAMEDKTSTIRIGAEQATETNFFSGSLALVMLAQAQISAADLVNLTRLCTQHFGSP